MKKKTLISDLCWSTNSISCQISSPSLTYWQRHRVCIYFTKYFCRILSNMIGYLALCSQNTIHCMTKPWWMVWLCARLIMTHIFVSVGNVQSAMVTLIVIWRHPPPMKISNERYTNWLFCQIEGYACKTSSYPCWIKSPHVVTYYT